jgi:acyl-CoA thioester hydrolase
MHKEEAAQRTLVQVTRIPVRWGDMDAMGHVNNTVYFRYMEQARIDWFEGLTGFDKAWISTSIVIVSTSCNFRRPIGYPATVEVRVLAGEPGASSVPTFYELRVEGERELYADGAAVVVFVDPQKQKPVRIPDAIRELLKEGIA